MQLTIFILVGALNSVRKRYQYVKSVQIVPDNGIDGSMSVKLEVNSPKNAVQKFTIYARDTNSMKVLNKGAVVVQSGQSEGKTLIETPESDFYIEVESRLWLRNHVIFRVSFFDISLRITYLLFS